MCHCRICWNTCLSSWRSWAIFWRLSRCRSCHLMAPLTFLVSRIFFSCLAVLAGFAADANWLMMYVLCSDADEWCLGRAALSRHGRQDRGACSTAEDEIVGLAFEAPRMLPWLRVRRRASFDWCPTVNASLNGATKFRVAPTGRWSAAELCPVPSGSLALVASRRNITACAFHFMDHGAPPVTLSRLRGNVAE